MEKFLVHIGINIFSTSSSRRMIPGSTGGLGGADNTDVPTIHNGLDDGDEIPIIPKIAGPSHRIKVRRNGDSDTILICCARLLDLENELQTFIDEGTARAQGELTTGTRWRSSRREIVTRWGDRVQNGRISLGEDRKGEETTRIRRRSTGRARTR
jgi:hypothetical protein